MEPGTDTKSLMLAQVQDELLLVVTPESANFVGDGCERVEGVGGFTCLGLACELKYVWVSAFTALLCPE